MVPQMSAPPGLHEISVSLTIASDPDGPLAGLLASAAYTPSKTALNALTAPARTARTVGPLRCHIWQGHLVERGENDTKGVAMKIFVAGATGVLGRRAVPALVDRGHDVRAVARSAAKADGLRQQGATPVTVDLFDRDAVIAAVDGHDVVVNLATAVPPTSRMLRRAAWRTTDRLRTEAAGNLVDGALATGARRYVQEAVCFIYPDAGAAWIDERAPLDPPAFAAAVAAAEAHTRRFTERGGVGVTLRYGAFYAADSPQVRDMLGVARRGLFPLPEPSDGYRPWVHIDDAAAAVVSALDVDAGPYNVVEDRPLTGTEHVDLLSELLGRRVRALPSALAIGGMLRFQQRSLRVSNRRLRAASDWRPTFGDRRDGWREVLARLDGASTSLDTGERQGSVDA